MVNVTLKAKHYYFVVNDLKNYSVSEYFGLIQKIKTACNGVADTDDVVVEISPAELIRIFNIMANKPEGQVNRINTEMMDILLPQIIAGVQASNQEWMQVSESVSLIRANNLAITDAAIHQGKTFLNQ